MGGATRGSGRLVKLQGGGWGYKDVRSQGRGCGGEEPFTHFLPFLPILGTGKLFSDVVSMTLYGKRFIQGVLKGAASCIQTSIT